MDKYVCTVCANVYDPHIGDPESGVLPGTLFENLPTDWTCPVCGSPKNKYRQLSQGEIDKFTQDGFGKYI